MRNTELTHCSDECIFSNLNKSKPVRMDENMETAWRLESMGSVTEEPEEN